MSDAILIVEDEPKLAMLLKEYLHQSQYQTHIIDNGLDVVSWVQSNSPRLILLDLMLPGKDGLEICREIRTFSNVPIIMMTAKVEEIDRLLGLQIGADDYICKPYSPREVVARVSTVLRRVEASPSLDHSEMSYRNIKLDESRFTCEVGEDKVELTRVEFRLILAMVRRPGHVFSREQLMDLVYTDQRVVSDRTIDSHIKNLRRKLNESSKEGDLIHSIYGVGYKLD
ncbi:MAG: response regulator [Porticoccaceae bacterium]|jgi:two-component system, OmpR family, response regulator BaeR|nr:response regulator [Porticoccaceae bacterium]